MAIHPTAVIGREVELGANVEVGPFTVIKGRVRIDSGTVIESHACIGNTHGIVEIGKNNHILSSAMVGGPPQDTSYKGEATQLIIGDSNVIREFTTINCGTTKDKGVTKIGSHCMLMSYVHIAHDCTLGDGVIIANSTQFAGHITVGDHCRIGGMVGIVQFAKIGQYAYIGGGASINKDILPYCIAEGSWARPRAANKVGMTRAGFSKAEVESVHRAIRFVIMGERTMEEALEKIKSECEVNKHTQHLIEFIKSSENGIAR